MTCSVEVGVPGVVTFPEMEVADDAMSLPQTGPGTVTAGAVGATMVGAPPAVDLSVFAGGAGHDASSSNPKSMSHRLTVV